MRKTLQLSLAITVLASTALFTACGGTKEVSNLDQAKAAALAADAQMDSQLRRFADAEKKLAEAVKLDPTADGHWFALAVVRRQQDNKSGARDAYKQVITICEKGFEKNPANSEFLLKQIQPLILLGRIDEARKLLEKARNFFPKDQDIRAMYEQHIIDQLITDPAIKNLSV